tara:strand:+ start:5579 stop:6283 length:705 start_codon:yes stop_codon:yes gene_type:complete
MLDNINQNKLLFLDIETCGGYKDLSTMKNSNPSLHSLFMEVGLSYFVRHYPEHKDDYSPNDYYVKYSALLPEFGRVVCVTVGFLNNGVKKTQTFYEGSENEILSGVSDLINKVDSLGFTLCGHNLKTFDLPYLGKRMVINGVNPPSLLPSHDTKPWEIRALDTKEMWNFGSFKGLSSLHLVCTVMGIDSPKLGEIKGSNIHDNFYNENNIVKIVEYCERDVTVLMDLVEKIKKL